MLSLIHIYYLKQEFAKIYAGVTGNTPNTQIKLTLGEIRSIQVNVMGEVVAPGTYTVSYTHLLR